MAQHRVDMAQLAFDEGRWSECIDLYTEVIDAGYALTSAWARRGVAKHERGDSHDALVDLTTALEIDREARMPNSKRDAMMALNNYHRGSALNTRGRVYFDLAMYEESLADFERSMEEDRMGDEVGEGTHFDSRIGEHLLWIGRARFLTGDEKGGIGEFEVGCRRYHSHACCGAEDELRRAIEEGGDAGFAALGRMPSTLLASDLRYDHGGGVCDPTFYGGCGRPTWTEEGSEADGPYPPFAAPMHGTDPYEHQDGQCGGAQPQCGEMDDEMCGGGCGGGGGGSCEEEPP